jgi:hypothetical protein
MRTKRLQQRVFQQYRRKAACGLCISDAAFGEWTGPQEQLP